MDVPHVHVVGTMLAMDVPHVVGTMLAMDVPHVVGTMLAWMSHMYMLWVQC